MSSAEVLAESKIRNFSPTPSIIGLETVSFDRCSQGGPQVKHLYARRLSAIKEQWNGLPHWFPRGGLACVKPGKNAGLVVYSPNRAGETSCHRHQRFVRLLQRQCIYCSYPKLFFCVLSINSSIAQHVALAAT